MAIKKLQNNFTTPEQSKRLLELGVPADSADCYWRKDKHGNLGYVSIIPSGGKLDERDYPCWSVGRLIEIMAVCYEFDLPDSGSGHVYATDIKKVVVIDVLISDIERFINKIDFSKLDE